MVAPVQRRFQEVHVSTFWLLLYTFLLYVMFNVLEWAFGLLRRHLVRSLKQGPK